MEILIVAPRSLISRDDITYRYQFPLGLTYISSVLKQAGYNVDCLNLNHYAGDTQSIIHGRLRNKKYDIVCTGGLSTVYKQVKSIVDAVKVYNSGNNVNIKVVLGGGLVTSEPELMLSALNPDFIVIGEGEKTIVELADCIGNNRDSGKIAGIGYRSRENKITITPQREVISDLDNLPLPDFEGFEFGIYLDNLHPNDQYYFDVFDYPRVYPILCSRSCPFLCTFCYHPLGNRYRKRSMGSVMEELNIMVKRYKINVLAIYDELFLNDRGRVMEFCEGMKKLQKELSWECKWYPQTRVDAVDDEILGIMKEAGCYMMQYGFESYNADVLKSMHKHITPGQIDRAIQLTLKNKITLQGVFIFGDPAETTKTATETLDFWKKHSYTGLVLDFIRPFPGTQDYKYCISRGLIKDKLDFIENHILDIMNMTEKMTDKEFDWLKVEVFKAELKYWYCATAVSMNKKSNNIYTVRVKCPHCREIIEYSNYEIPLRLFFIFQMHCRLCFRRFYFVSTSYKVIAGLLLMIFDSKLLPDGIKAFVFNFERKIRRPFTRRILMKRNE